VIVLRGGPVSTHVGSRRPDPARPDIPRQWSG
jgi:hypothetical protein